MAIIVSCDVCGSDTPYQTWIDQPGIQMEIPDQMLGDVGESTQGYTICSWKCVLELATEMADPNELAQAIDDQMEIDGEPVTHLHHGETQEEAEQEQREISRGRRAKLQPITHDPGITLDVDPNPVTLTDFLATQGDGRGPTINPVRVR